MNRAYMYRKVIIFSLIFFLISISITPVFGFLYNQNTSINKSNYLGYQEYPLPPPQFINISLEETIMRRASMREFSDEPVTDEELSTILWAAYGLREDGELTIAKINGSHAAVIFVLLEDVYTYNPTNHPLVFYKGSMRN